MTTPTTWIAFGLGLALHSAGCGADDVAPGSVPLGGECRGSAECEAVAGKVIRCSCTDQARRPICVADAEAGESCALTGNFQTPCRPGLQCVVGDPSSQDARCMAPAAPGEACGNGAALCEDPYFCDSTFHCALGEAALGASCSFPWSASCAAPNLCEIEGVCSAPAAVGEPCRLNDRNPCVAGSACSGSTQACEPLKSDGEECVFDDECSSGMCPLGLCGPGSLPDDVDFSCGF